MHIEGCGLIQSQRLRIDTVRSGEMVSTNTTKRTPVQRMCGADLASYDKRRMEAGLMKRQISMADRRLQMRYTDVFGNQRQVRCPLKRFAGVPAPTGWGPATCCRVCAGTR